MEEETRVFRENCTTGCPWRHQSLAGLDASKITAKRRPLGSRHDLFGEIMRCSCLSNNFIARSMFLSAQIDVRIEGVS